MRRAQWRGSIDRQRMSAKAEGLEPHTGGACQHLEELPTPLAPSIGILLRHVPLITLLNLLGGLVANHSFAPGLNFAASASVSVDSSARPLFRFVSCYAPMLSIPRLIYEASAHISHAHLPHKSEPHPSNPRIFMQSSSTCTLCICIHSFRTAISKTL